MTIAAAESEDPAHNVATAVRAIIVRIMIFYIGSIVVITMALPFSSIQDADVAADDLRTDAVVTAQDAPFDIADTPDATAGDASPAEAADERTGTWEPVPVPRPTYTMKARAGARPAPAPVTTDGPQVLDAIEDDVLEPAPRVVGG